MEGRKEGRNEEGVVLCWQLQLCVVRSCRGGLRKFLDSMEKDQLGRKEEVEVCFKQFSRHMENKKMSEWVIIRSCYTFDIPGLPRHKLPT